MKKIIALFAALPALLFAAPQNIQKDGGALTASFTVPSGVSISATGTGTISATSVTGLSVASGKTLTVSNTLTFTGTDSSSVNFGAGGTVSYASGTLTANRILIGTGTAIAASDLSYATPTMTVPDAFSITSAGSIDLVAGGSNKNISLTPTGTGNVYTATGMRINAASSSDGSVVNVLMTSVAPPTTGTTAGAGVNVYSSGNVSLLSGVNALATPFPGWIQVADRTALGTKYPLWLQPSGGPVVINGGTPTYSRSAWGITGPQLQVAAMTVTDTASSGTVASAVANSFAVSTFAASSSTTFTSAATVYIAGDVSAGSNVTLTATYGLWNAGKTRLDGDIILGDRILATTAINGKSIYYSGGSGYTDFMNIFKMNNAANSDFLSLSQTGASYSGIIASVGNNEAVLYSPSKFTIARGTGAAEAISFDGSTFAVLPGSIVGGPGNMTITAGTGNSRTMVLRTTTSGGTATTALTLNATQDATLAGDLTVSGGDITVTGSFVANTTRLTATGGRLSSSGGGAAIILESNGSNALSALVGSWTGGASNLTIIAGTGASRTMAFQTTTSGSTATTALTLNADQTATFAASLTATGSTLGSNAAAGSETINGPTASTRDFRFQTAGVNRWIIRANSNAESSANAGTSLVLAARDDAGSALGNVLDITRATGKLQVQPVSGSVAAWGVTGVAFAINYSTNTATMTDSSSTGTVASAVASSFGAPTFAASSATTYTAAANVYIAGDVVAGSNVTLTASYGLWNAGKTRLDGNVLLAGTLTKPGGASIIITNTALTDGAGVATGTLTTAPSAGNPTKWIGINDNGTTRYVPAW